jgi:hypothetical protein
VGHDVSENWVNFSHNSTFDAARCALAPLTNRLLRGPVALRHDPRRLVARVDSSPDLWRRRRLHVKLDQHPCTSFRMSLRTDLAMKNVDRRWIDVIIRVKHSNNAQQRKNRKPQKCVDCGIGLGKSDSSLIIGLRRIFTIMKQIYFEHCFRTTLDHHVSSASCVRQRSSQCFWDADFWI